MMMNSADDDRLIIKIETASLLPHRKALGRNFAVVALIHFLRLEDEFPKLPMIDGIHLPNLPFLPILGLHRIQEGKGSAGIAQRILLDARGGKIPGAARIGGE